MALEIRRPGGLKSRFATTIEFSDYDADELMQITDTMLAADMFVLSDGARDALMTIYTIMATVRTQGLKPRTRAVL